MDLTNDWFGKGYEAGRITAYIKDTKSSQAENTHMMEIKYGEKESSQFYLYLAISPDYYNCAVLV
jgi:hypothetical protein